MIGDRSTLSSMLLAGPPLRILLVDDHPMFRAGFALRVAEDFNVIGEAGNAAEALDVASRFAIDCAIIDVFMPVTSGISLAAELHKVQPHCRILGLSGSAEPSMIANLLRAGASGFALKTQPVLEIIEAIRTVARGVRYLPPSTSVEAVDSAIATTDMGALGALTRREREVFELVIRGHTSASISSALGISPRTVETHRLRASQKLATHSIADMMRANAAVGDLA
ncbi:MAG: response regulator transcription factor [Gemmatimonadaceae bacterium]